MLVNLRDTTDAESFLELQQNGSWPVSSVELLEPQIPLSLDVKLHVLMYSSSFYMRRPCLLFALYKFIHVPDICLKPSATGRSLPVLCLCVVSQL